MAARPNHYIPRGQTMNWNPDRETDRRERIDENKHGHVSPPFKNPDPERQERDGGGGNDDSGGKSDG